MDLDKARKKIDGIDYDLVALLKQRMELCLRVGRLKDNVYEPEREKKVIENVRASASGIAGADFCEDLYRRIIHESTRLQKEGLKLVGFQGEHGAYSEAAALAYDPSAVPIPCREFPEVFAEVAAGQLDFGIVPVENSLEGAVTQVNDLLAKTELKIVGEITLPIHHCLLALPETNHRDLKVIYSHPQALAQCRGFLSRHKIEARPFYDTAGAAKMLSHEGSQSAAVIASALCAKLYHLNIVKEDIGDHESNSTRFIILSSHEAAEEGDKCSIVFSIAHETGSLSSVMKVFSDAGINLTRIESRPLRSVLGYYRFFLDFEGSHKDQVVIDALKSVRRKTKTYRFLGCYRGIRA